MANKGSQSTARQTRPIVLNSEIGQLPALTGFLRLSGLPIARVRIGCGHMDRADIADPTVPLAAVPLPTHSQGARDGPSAPITVRPGSEDRTAGGAL